ncbi:hypothetical protein RHGRI_025442 [Rhododendron griersonianum]|uniref:glucomannan 4-beta-mannosyltransferase n=1 Tax=Rhododendron griersonianum TaxID=479676 RepID=A0AAV6IP93_9ERIC|nr:hypothetical protein RHGRI_025442 [Rhododendron griersonianum]
MDTLSSAAEIGMGWEQAWRASAIAPVLRWTVAVCLAMSIMVLVDRVYMGIVIMGVKLSRRRGVKKYKWEPIKGDLEVKSEAYPMVYQLSIGAACRLSWPLDRIIIQVLDDSTDPVIKLVGVECRRWASKGINIKRETRENRNGYKAGALKEGMRLSYASNCEYVAIFDADFQPEPDFLWRAIPFLLHNPDVALVQARWKFVNADECLMTRIQEMSMDYHFEVEQEVGSSAYAFFGFNGTAGVWRISAINEAGGWRDRTTVEDMDLAVKNELPSTFKAYRDQQHRWFCGSANLFRKVAIDILGNKKASLWKKLYVIYSFFFVRKIVIHIFTFIFHCVVLPATVLVPEVEVPAWGSVYIPLAIAILKVIGTPRVHLSELIVGIYLFICGCYGVAFGKSQYCFLYLCLFLQSIAFFITGVGYIGVFVPNNYY